MSDSRIDPDAPSLDLNTYTVEASKVQGNTIDLPFNGKPMVTIRPDGQLEFGEDYQPDAAAQVFWDAVRRFAPTQMEQQFGKPLAARVDAQLKAGQEAEQALTKLRQEVDGMRNCCAANRPRLSRMRDLLDMPASDPGEPTT